MSLSGVLILAAAAATSGASAGAPGAEVLSAEVRAEIVRPAIVRQASGLEPQRDAPSAQVSRRGRTILVEFQ